MGARHRPRIRLRALAQSASDSFRGVQLGGARALVTGATGGIGDAIARALHARGAHVLLSGRRQEALDELAGRLGERTEVLVADLAERDAPTRLADAAGAVDVLVANAALPASGRVEDFSHDEIDRALDVNLRAPIQLTRALLPGMLARGRGHVVLVSSLSGKTASPRSGIYSATKFGLRGFAAGLREDVEPKGIGVTVVFPGFVSEAGLFAESGVRLPPWVGTRTPEQVAAAVVARDRARPRRAGRGPARPADRHPHRGPRAGHGRACAAPPGLGADR